MVKPKKRTMSEFKIGCSPQTSEIYAGEVVKDGSMRNKKIVTDSAVSSVAIHLIQKDVSVNFSHAGKNYKMQVVEV